MTKKANTPKRYADHITTTTQVTDRVKLAYSEFFTAHVVYVDNIAVAHTRRMGVHSTWTVVIGDPDGDNLKFAGLAQSEDEAVSALKGAASKLAAVA